MTIHRPLAPEILAGRPGPPSRVCFLYIAQAHQTLHSLSAAVELARSRPDIRVDVAATSQPVLDYARKAAEALGPAPVGWRLLGPAWLRGVRLGDDVPPKVPMLLANAGALGGYDVIVAPERTTAMLRRLAPHARLVYSQHGAGDRAGPFEPRLRQFDLVFVAGRKQRDRIVAEGLLPAERCAVVGYPKFDLVDALQPRAPRLFADDRPVVLYNPHFSAELGSWRKWGARILRTFAEQDRFNLIFAPHLRLFRSASPRRVPELAPFVGHRRIHMDLGGTPAAIDMTYTRMADVYLGDVSSQVYEFLRDPRPCVFLNAHGRAWTTDESYRHWCFGPVLDTLDGLIDQIGAAQTSHARYAAAQREGFRYTFDLTGPSSSRRAADAIAQLASAAAAPAAAGEKGGLLWRR